MPTIKGAVYDSSGAAVAGRVVRVYRRDTGALLGVTTSSDGTEVGGDSLFDDVSLLLHFDKNVSDSSNNAQQGTLVSPATISTDGAQFGDAGLLVGAGGAVTVPSHASFALPGDFTIECAFRSNWAVTSGSLLNIGAYNSGILLRVQPNLIELFMNGANHNISYPISSGDWHHIAWQRAGNVNSLYLDGALVGSTSALTSTVPAGAVMVGRSAHNSGEYLSGSIDEVRITKGVARYSGAFTPPTSAYPNSKEGATPAVGDYSLTTAFVGEVQRIVLDDDAGELFNDLIDRVVLT